MARRCDICGKGPDRGRQYERRGKAKEKGGVGEQITGKSKRTFYPNIQKVRAYVDGETKRIKACTTCIKSGRVEKPPLD